MSKCNLTRQEEINPRSQKTNFKTNVNKYWQFVNSQVPMRFGFGREGAPFFMILYLSFICLSPTLDAIFYINLDPKIYIRTKQKINKLQNKCFCLHIVYGF